jgi:hypothetical protein
LLAAPLGCWNLASLRASVRFFSLPSNAVGGEGWGGEVLIAYIHDYPSFLDVEIWCFSGAWMLECLELFSELFSIGQSPPHVRWSFRVNKGALIETPSGVRDGRQNLLPEPKTYAHALQTSLNQSVSASTPPRQALVINHFYVLNTTEHK